jgi:hypothetical protein
MWAWSFKRSIEFVRANLPPHIITVGDHTARFAMFSRQLPPPKGRSFFLGAGVLPESSCIGSPWKAIGSAVPRAEGSYDRLPWQGHIDLRDVHA